MNEHADNDPSGDSKSKPGSDTALPATSAKGSGAPTGERLRENRRWWISLLIQPALLLTCGVLLIVGLGVAQRLGWIAADRGSSPSAANAGGDTRYICPMMCTPPQTEPGRCPVCAMELVPSTSGADAADSRSILVDPAARRVANIQTVPVVSMPISRTIRAIGELTYDEGSLKTISAYVDGRLDRLYADYTGVVVKKGDRLALLYSPQLYTSQVELLLARKARDEGRSAAARTARTGRNLVESARQRLIELGMTPSQIEALERAGTASSRMHLLAPISGTVIQKMAVEGQYIREGEAIYQLADLSTVWLMLQLFPEDAAAIRYGQKVQAEVHSLPGRSFQGRVAFIDPNVDATTRTVGVRVVMSNEGGLLRVGDYAQAVIDATVSGGQPTRIYDPELADKWISPRHPHVIADAPGVCPICGVELVPAAQFGFTEEPMDNTEALVVPRDAVLMAGGNSVLYVETEPGRFEIRRVVLGPTCEDQIVIRSGVALGEQVATRGNFLIDSQMQLAGNPSLIDPGRLESRVGPPEIAELDSASPDPTVAAALEQLPPADRVMAERQRLCPVADTLLGSMGPPPKVDVKGTAVFICCEGCRDRLLAEPERYLAKLAKLPNVSRHSSGGPAPMDLPPIGRPQRMEPEEPVTGADAEQSKESDSAPRDTRDPSEAVR